MPSIAQIKSDTKELDRLKAIVRNSSAPDPKITEFDIDHGPINAADLELSSGGKKWIAITVTLEGCVFPHCQPLLEGGDPFETDEEPQFITDTRFDAEGTVVKTPDNPQATKEDEDRVFDDIVLLGLVSGGPHTVHVNSTAYDDPGGFWETIRDRIRDLATSATAPLLAMSPTAVSSSADIVLDIIKHLLGAGSGKTGATIRIVRIDDEEFGKGNHTGSKLEVRKWSAHQDNDTLWFLALWRVTLSDFFSLGKFQTVKNPRVHIGSGETLLKIRPADAQHGDG